MHGKMSTFFLCVLVKRFEYIKKTLFKEAPPLQGSQYYSHASLWFEKGSKYVSSLHEVRKKRL